MACYGMELAEPANETRVLVIYSGGTIGMLESPQGKRTYPGFLYDNLQAQARFNDPSGLTIFSHSLDIATFTEWRTSSRFTKHGSRETSRAPSPSPVTATTPVSAAPSSPLPASSAHHYPIRTDLDQPSYMPVMTKDGLIQLPSLKTPRSSGKCVRYCIYEYERLIDSSDVGIDEWLRMASDIELNYKLYDSFIILHGTDTMAYSASALSFLLEHLGKPVILTGAQIPLSEVRNDAVDNLLGALALAGNYVIPEVTLFFHHTLFRGCRSTKSSSSDFEAFSSPNMAPLARVGITIDVDWHLVQRPTSLQPFHVHKSLCANVATLRLFPGITTASVKSFLRDPIQGIVLSTYGAGNCPQRKDLLDAFREASDRGVVLVNVTQCQKGTVVGSLYENGRKLEQAGVIGGGDMTIECALAKLSYLLSKDLSPQQVRDIIGKPIRGDLTPPKPPINELAGTNSDLSRGNNSSRIRELFSRLLLLSEPPRAEHTTNDSRDAPRENDKAIDNDVGAEEINENHLAHIEDTLNPLLINAAASRADGTLKSILATLLYDQNSTSPSIQINDNPDPYTTKVSQGLSLLNSFSTMSPLHTACLHDIPQNVQLLLSHGASVHLRDIQGHTALYYAAFAAAKHKQGTSGSREKRLETVTLLKEAGAHLVPWETEALARIVEETDPELWHVLTYIP